MNSNMVWEDDLKICFTNSTNSFPRMANHALTPQITPPLLS